MFEWDSEDRALSLSGDAEAPILDWDSDALRAERERARLLRWFPPRALRSRARAPAKLLLFAGNPVLLAEVTLATARNEIYPALREASLLHLGIVLYDLIPIFHPEFCARGVRAEFPGFLRLVRHADAIAAISRAVASEVENLLPAIRRRLPHPPLLRVVPLAGDFEAGARAQRDAAARGGPGTAGAPLPLALCVGTLEPRKNGKRILRAAILAMRQGHRFELLFAGNRGWLGTEFDSLVAACRKQGYPVGIRRAVPEAELDALYRRARFTLFCSFAEGFGLPILESLQRGVPCITSRVGSQLELAQPGGCLCVDPYSVEQIRDAIVTLLQDEREYSRLRAEIAARRFRGWNDVASDIFELCSEMSA
jgi:glycosyltransferase involved in cell wall biosynthesis